MARASKKTAVQSNAQRQVNVYGIDGKVKGSAALPAVFSTPLRPDIIRRAVVSAQANRRQRYGPSKVAGMRHSVATWGKGRGTSRVQRLKAGRNAAQSPNNVGGRRAHPPRPEHDFTKRINVKERKLAIASALAASSNPEVVRARGHRFNEGITLPIVVDDAAESLDKTKDVQTLLAALGLGADLQRAIDGTHVRAGRGKMRGRRYRVPSSILLVATSGSPVIAGARNLPGVSATSPRGLNAEYLAPGGDPGRLVVISRKALETLGGA
jgi:large subunit ribosomal protein L4e